MRRAIAGLIAVMPLALGVAVAHADGPGAWGDGGAPQGVPVIGTVVQTDPATGSFTANAFVPTESDQPGDDDPGLNDGSGSGPASGPSGSFGGDFRHAEFGGSGNAPATTPVTITTDSNTNITVNGSSGSVSDMKVGDHFVALFTGSPTDSIQTLVASPALAVFDRTPPPRKQVYAFVGTVTATDTTNGTVTLTVTRSYPSGLAAANSSVTLTVSADTLILGGTSSSGFGNTLADVSTGDVVAGGLLAPQGETLAQVEALPLQMLLDLPASSSSTATSAVKQDALKQALKLLGVHHSRKHTAHHRRHHSRKHAKKG